MVSRDISNKGSGNYSNSYQMSNNRNNSNNSMFTSNDNSSDMRDKNRSYYEEKKTCSQGIIQMIIYFIGNLELASQSISNENYYRSESNELDFQGFVRDFIEVSY